VGVYHSHPACEAVPSRTDLAENYYPDAVHVIVSLAGADPVVRAYLLTAHDYRELTWKTAPAG
jgi:proteasome lid subunit RPN8/RPN11